MKLTFTAPQELINTLDIPFSLRFSSLEMQTVTAEFDSSWQMSICHRRRKIVLKRDLLELVFAQPAEDWSGILELQYRHDMVAPVNVSVDMFPQKFQEFLSDAADITETSDMTETEKDMLDDGEELVLHVHKPDGTPLLCHWHNGGSSQCGKIALTRQSCVGVRSLWLHHLKFLIILCLLLIQFLL